MPSLELRKGGENSKTPIQEFYSGSNVFLTGATGFFGKVIIDKLFRLTPDIGLVYIMVRSKKDKSIEQRIDQLFSDPVFDRLKSEVPDFRSKIYPISGDCVEPELGISQQDRNILISKVNIVFHAAATVKFDENIKTALTINVKGTKALLDICNKCLNLKSIIHVSTAFAHCTHFEIDEKFYEPISDTEDLLRYVETKTNEDLENMTSKILGPYPNTYAFTKALGEDIVRKYCKNLPIAVFRPAIVIGSYREPIPGWIDNMYGPTGVVLGVGAGLLRVMCADRDRVADIVPIDLVVNAILATAWDVSTTIRTAPTLPPITNYVSSRRNPITWGQFFFWNMTFGQAFPTSHAMWYYTLIMTPKKYLYLFLSIFLHFLPGIIIDCFLILTGRKPRMVRAYKKIHKFLEVIAFFSTHQWSFEDDRVQNLWEKMEPRDQKLLSFQIEQLEWDTFFFNNIKTMRWCLMNDKTETLPLARKRMARLRVIHNSMKILVLYLFMMLIYKYFSKYFL